MSATAEDILRRRLGDRSDVLFLHVRVADHCNHACEHCYQVQGQKGELETAGVIEVIDGAAAAGTLFLTISGGEATLRPDLFEIIAHARSLNLAVALFTNGFSLDEAMADRLAGLGLWHVQVSLYSMNPVIHEAVTRVPGSHARTLRAIELLRARRVTVVISMPTMARNAQDVEEVRAFAERLDCALKISDQLHSGEDGSSRNDLGLSDEAHARHLRDMPAIDYGPDAIATRRRGSTCSVGRGGLAVEPNGEVRPCTQLHVPLGNALRESLEAISDGDDARFLRSIDIRSLHGCRDCDLIVGCNRCHGTAATEAGDALGPYLSACRGAVARYRATHKAAVVIKPLAEPDRPTEMGPFRIEAPGVLQAIADVRTPDDDALASRFPWIRPHRGYDREVLMAPKGELVQLRAKRFQTRSS